MNIILAGAKGAGKSTVAKQLESLLGLACIETDRLIEQRFAAQQHGQKTCRQIYNELGSAAFRTLEKEAVRSLADADWRLIVCGGSTLMDGDNRRVLLNNAILIYLKADAETLWSRISKDGLPAWLQACRILRDHH